MSLSALIAVEALIIIGVIATLLIHRLLAKSGVINATSAPELSPFHPLILAIEIGAGLAVIGGIAVCIFASGWILPLIGAAMILSGGSVFSFGFISHSPATPREAGRITFFDSPLCIFGRPVVVGGKVFVLPLIMDSVKVAIDNQEHIIDVTVISKGPVKIPILGKTIVTYRPNINDLDDYIQAGNNMKKVAGQLDGPVAAETRAVAAKMDPLEISQQGTIISDKLELKIKNDLFQQKRLGLEVMIVRTDFPLPQKVQDSMHDVLIEKFQRDAESTDSQTITKIARTMQREDAVQHLTAFDGKGVEDLTAAELAIVDHEIDKPGGLLEKKKVFDFEHYRQAAERRRLIRDGKVTKIEGVTGSFALQNTNQ